MHELDIASISRKRRKAAGAGSGMQRGTAVAIGVLHSACGGFGASASAGIGGNVTYGKRSSPQACAAMSASRIAIDPANQHPAGLVLGSMACARAHS